MPTVADPSVLSAEERAIADRIRPHLRPGMLVAFADGAGMPVGLGRPLAHAARQVGGVRLLLGWSFQLPMPLDAAAFPDVRAILGGYGLRRKFGRNVHYLPVRLSAVPGLLRSVLRPDLLLVGLRPGPRGLTFGSEMAWLPAAIEVCGRILVEVNGALPAAAGSDPVLHDRITVVNEVDRPALALPVPTPDTLIESVGERVAALVRPGHSVQFGPGGVGDATLRALQVPVRVDSGVIGDAVVDLHDRGLLAGPPLATYLAGTPALYEWADGRPLLARLEHTHDVGRLAEQPLIAINTALEVDTVGQVNVEGLAGDVIAGVGGHPDYAGGAAHSADGLSVVALPTVRGGHRTLVDVLDAPTSTTRSDVDVIVTELGTADLRGLDDAERAAALRAIWGQ